MGDRRGSILHNLAFHYEAKRVSFDTDFISLNTLSKIHFKTQKRQRPEHFVFKSRERQRPEKCRTREMLSGR